MSITSIVFSKDRPAQLDLLLRSMKQNAPGLWLDEDGQNSVVVIVKETNRAYRDAYAICRDEHEVSFMREREEWTLKQITNGWTQTGDHVVFFTDDDVVYRRLPVSNPAWWLDLFPETLCFSLRLGRNTRRCYPMGDAPQDVESRLSLGDFDVWRWQSADHDLGYPGSLDGHIFRSEQVHAMIAPYDYANPNQLEEILVRGCRSQMLALPHMAAFKESVLVGCPVNLVNETHRNRHGGLVWLSPEALLKGFAEGRRLALESVVASQIDAAHVEVPLLWEDEA